MITGSADQTAKLWDVKSGKELFTFKFGSPTRSVDFALGDHLAVITTDHFVDRMAAIHVKRIAQDPEDRKLYIHSRLNYYLSFSQFLVCIKGKVVCLMHLCRG